MNRPILLLAATAWLCTAQAAPPGPAELYGPLFEAVQGQRIFPDGKLFVDAVPRSTPDRILRAYRAEQPQGADALRAFVARHFDLPGEAKAPPATLTGHIAALWPQLTRPALTPPPGGSALALPAPSVVPGGRFREIYYWDSFFTMLGLKADGQTALIDGMLTDFESLIDRYGHIPNGTRTYYLGRSQPPFFSQMVDLAADTDPARRKAQLPGPRDESWAEDVATAKASPRPASEIYRHLRAGAESGWDFSSRWLDDPMNLASIRTTDVVPVDLNSLLWALETNIARRCAEAKDLACAADFSKRERQRAAAIRRYLWVGKQGRFGDWDRKAKRITPILSAATLYPLFVGLADRDQANRVARTTRTALLAPGGLRTTGLKTGQQWDRPNGWAPLQWVAIDGLARYGQDALARDIAKRWIGTVDAAYRQTGKMLEKYDVEDRKPGGGGEYPLQDGFGWTNGVTRALIARYPDLDPDR